ncbi:thioesterase family protein [Burkholderia pseudomultivorans]|uniref:L-carnitine dehydrogenase n=1 Tax=Burkholderia pseudomultivorans TaxID=1207504 RepID=A0ABU2DZA8_9BURK|nr:thioesterase family protein [Burkholderia pseudomultivorans]MDR8727323.1 L-carnitine dehydrogenase [Burkholderia pseudomultivorans]MDR8732585.1 L-carnitine dehydrogenase [Burkholderia pseudomultivorans]MDR8739451.1 L-carnitine dehydrogenase [Burkholderia pseudomultivorans]MDR8752931.1 L-carnitine dehydrogenase [Burkholderia pseudomultivorans]MDR8778218.1 L-carnitine dehydrogenase [Burkholderia pseudomultivorans]
MTTHPSPAADPRLRSAYEGQKSRPYDPDAPIATPLELHRCVVRPEWVDYNGHMSESCYLFVFGDSSDAFFRYFGIDDDYRDAGRSIFSAETHIRHLGEAMLGDPLRLTLRLLDVDDRRLHVFHSMHHATTGAQLATGEQLLTHVDLHAKRSTPFPDAIRRHLDAIRAAHARAPREPHAGRAIAIRRPAPASR